MDDLGLVEADAVKLGVSLEHKASKRQEFFDGIS